MKKFLLDSPPLSAYLLARPPYGPGLIGDIDTLIAATALEHDLTVVTTDSDFQRVPGLKVQIVTLR